MLSSTVFEHGITKHDARLRSAHHKLNFLINFFLESDEYPQVKLLLDKLKKYHKLDSIGGHYAEVIECVHEEQAYADAWSMLSSKLFHMLTSSELEALRKQCLHHLFNAEPSALNIEIPFTYREHWAITYWSGYLLSKSILFKPVLQVALKIKLNHLLKTHPILVVAHVI